MAENGQTVGLNRRREDALLEAIRSELQDYAEADREEHQKLWKTIERMASSVTKAHEAIRELKESHKDMRMLLGEVRSEFKDVKADTHSMAEDLAEIAGLVEMARLWLAKNGGRLGK